MTARFSIRGIVDSVGENFMMSGVSKTFNDWGDPTESYTPYTLRGVVQVMDGSETEVIEGILQREDIIVFVDEEETNAGSIATENYFTMSGAAVGLVAGVYRVVNVIHNEGHYEVYAKRHLSK